MSDETSKHGFNFTHVAIVGTCAFALVALTFMKSGFQLKPNIGNAQEAGAQNQTLSEALAQEESKLKIGDAGYLDEDYQNAMAILDPDRNGEVLGATTDDLGLGKIEITNDELNQIWVEMTHDTSKERMELYKSQLSYIESSQDALSLLSVLGSESPETLESAAAQSRKIVAYLKAVEVPESFLRYHKLKIFFYGNIALLADGFTDKKQVASFGESLFSIMEQIEQETVRIKTQYNFDL